MSIFNKFIELLKRQEERYLNFFKKFYFAYSKLDTLSITVALFAFSIVTLAIFKHSEDFYILVFQIYLILFISLFGPIATFKDTMKYKSSLQDTNEMIESLLHSNKWYFEKRSVTQGKLNDILNKIERLTKEPLNDEKVQLLTDLKKEVEEAEIELNDLPTFLKEIGHNKSNANRLAAFIRAIPTLFALIIGLNIYLFSLFYFISDVSEDIKSFSDAIYFSIVTFTTLGYGDITPDNFKILTALQALSGLILSSSFIGQLIAILSSVESKKVSI